MNPVLVSIGPFALRWYGVLIVGGIVIAAYISTFEARRRGENPDHVWNTLTWCLLFGIIGGRLYHVFSSPADGVGFAYYREHPLEAINPFGSGGFGYRGLGIYGGLVGGIFAVWLYTQVLVRLEWKGLRAKIVYPPLNLLRWFDIAAPGVLLAQAIGRFGNFVNQELYGPPTTLPWGFKINPNYPYQAPPAGLDIATTRFHPTFFYESGWCLIMFLLLIYIARRYAPKLKEGDIFLGYFIAYPLGRFWVEMFRPDAWKMGDLATAQWISLISIVTATAILIYRHRHGAPPAAVSIGEPLPTKPPQEMAAEVPEQAPSDTRSTGVQ